MKTSPRLFLLRMPYGSAFVFISAACQSLPALSVLRASFRSPRFACRSSGRAAGRVRLSSSACLDVDSRECVDCVECLFSVDCSGAVVYIVSRALKVFLLSLFFLAPVFVRAALLVLLPPSLSPMSQSVPPGHDGSDFLSIFISSHPISRLLAYLLSFAARLPSYPSRPVPRPATIDTIGGEVHGCDTADGGGLSCLPRAGGDGW